MPKTNAPARTRCSIGLEISPIKFASMVSSAKPDVPPAAASGEVCAWAAVADISSTAKTGSKTLKLRLENRAVRCVKDEVKRMAMDNPLSFIKPSFDDKCMTNRDKLEQIFGLAELRLPDL